MGPLIEMLRRSDTVTVIILTLLALFSIVSWAIIVNRFLYLTSVKSLHKKFLVGFRAIASLSELPGTKKELLLTPMGETATLGLDEFRRIVMDTKSHKKGVTDWSFYFQNQLAMVQEKLGSEIGRLTRRLDWGLYLLAVISSTAPFMGLFGTVWGIMNSFYAIGEQGSASLPVVAPGIAAALVTTIVGLSVAIPAVIFYNVFNHKVQRLEDEMFEFGDLLHVQIKQELFDLLFGEKKTEAPVDKSFTSIPSTRE